MSCCTELHQAKNINININNQFLKAIEGRIKKKQPNVNQKNL